MRRMASKGGPRHPVLSDKGKAAAARRKARQAAALRENLRRRKQQTRGRAASDPKSTDDGQD